MARNYNKGRYFPRFPEKYKGNINTIEYRSSWERKVMNWCDKNKFVVEWSSEEIVIPYICRTDNLQHRYYMDLYIKFRNGEKRLIEIKPFQQTLQPIKKKQHMKTFLNQVLTYTKNVSKWEQAKKYAEKRGYIFQVWTENELRKLGIMV